MKHLLIISLILLFSCIENEKPLTLEEKEIAAIEFVNSFLLDGYKELDIVFFPRGEDVDFIESFTYSELRNDYFDLLFYVENFDSLSNVYGKEYILEAIEFKKKLLIFKKTYTGFKIHKHFHLYDMNSPLIIQVFWIDLNLELRAQSTLRFPEIHLDTIDGNPTYYYIDTSKYVTYCEIWN